MKCSNCGMEVPFAGKACPHCHADRSIDRLYAGFGVSFAVAGATIGGIVGYAAGGPGGVLVGGLISALILCVIGVGTASALYPRR